MTNGTNQAEKKSSAGWIIVLLILAAVCFFVYNNYKNVRVTSDTPSTAPATSVEAAETVISESKDSESSTNAKEIAAPAEVETNSEAPAEEKASKPASEPAVEKPTTTGPKVTA